MKRLDQKSIAKEFNKQKDIFREWGEGSGFVTALQQISQALSDLREAGLDVSLNITGGPSDMSFRMFSGGSLISPIEGILRIGANERLLAISVKDRQGACLKLALSELDIRHDGMDQVIMEKKIKTTVRSHIYDLKNDPEALIKFQQEIIQFAARNTVIFENDVAEAFEGNNKLHKPVSKLGPKTA